MLGLIGQLQPAMVSSLVASTLGSMASASTSADREAGDGLQEEGPALIGAGLPGAKARDRLRGAKAEVSWLMRTQYISAETPNRRPGPKPEKRPRPSHHKAEDEPEDDTLEGQITAIEVRTWD